MRILMWTVALILSPVMVLAGDVTVFAASSLKSALERVAADWSAQTGQKVLLSFGSSSALAQQIEAGAPADLYLSAATGWMDYLQERERIVSATRRDLWGNGLSLIAHDAMAQPIALEPGADLAGLIGEEKLAMALVASVPVGQYGKAALEALGLWDTVAPQVVQTQDARATLALVASGEAGFGVVYATDARAAEAAGLAVEIGLFPGDSHPAIVYPGAVVAGGNEAGAQALLDHLGGPAAAAVFAAEGYVILPHD